MESKKKRIKSLWRAFFISFALIICTAATIAVFAIYVIPSKKIEEIQKNDGEYPLREVTQAQLNSPNVTIEEVVFFEQSYNEKHRVENRDQKIIDRIFALKHILLGALMPEEHDRKELLDIYTVHDGEFSPEQQAVLEWYFALDKSQQEQWSKCPKVNNLAEFKEAIKKQNNIK